VAAHLQLAAGACVAAGLGITGVASKAYRASAVEAALIGQQLDEQVVAVAAAHAVDGVDANGDLSASADYRRHLAQVHTRRAITRAVASLK
jgi:carbon-monoxide dehydrogenase medium subunit